MRAQARRQAWAVVLAVVGMLLSAGGTEANRFGPPVQTDGGYPPMRLYPEQVQAIRTLKAPPDVGARSALVVDMDSGSVLYAKDPQAALPPASTAKVMTALVVLERVKLDEQVVVSPSAAAMEGSRMGLVAGESLTVEDLLYGLLLPSGNDAAVALAEHVAGSEEAFVALMNAKAQDLGLAQSHFANAHGLDDPAQTMSAADLIVVTRAALEYPVFAKIVASPSAEVAGRTLTTTNELLGSDPAADGIKTGTTDEAGQCLVASRNSDGHRVLAAVLGSSDRYADARTLLDYASAGWRWADLELPGGALDWELGPDGRWRRLHALERRSVFLPAWQWALAQPERLLDPAVPLTSTLPVGAVRLRLGGEVLAQTPLGAWQGP